MEGPVFFDFFGLFLQKVIFLNGKIEKVEAKS